MRSLFTWPQTDRVVLDPPLHAETLRRFREYEILDVRYIVQIDPEDGTTYGFEPGDLVRRDDLDCVETRHGSLPFPVGELLSLLDTESGDLAE